MEQGEVSRQVSGALLIRSGSLIIPGMAENGENVFWSRVVPEETEDIQFCGSLYLLADGQGSAGIQACRKALSDIPAAYYQKYNLPVSQRLQAVIQTTGAELYIEFSRSGEIDGLIHLTAVVVVDNHLYISNVGANRAYLIHDGDAQQITRDPNQLSELLRQGIDIVEEAQEAAGKNRPGHHLGDNPSPQMDLFENIPVFPGDVLLICNEVAALQFDEDQIASAVENDDPVLVCEKIASFGKGPEEGENQILLALVFSQPEPIFIQPVQSEDIQSGATGGSSKKTRSLLAWSFWKNYFSRKVVFIPAAVLVFLVLTLLFSEVFWRRASFSADLLVTSTAAAATSFPTAVSEPSSMFSPPVPTFENKLPSVELHTLTLVATSSLPISRSSSTPVPSTESSELACVWEVSSGNSLFSTVRKFDLPYRDSEDYFFFDECNLENGVCQGKRQEIQSHSSIEPGWFVMIPVVNQEACQKGGGVWVIVQR